MPVSQQRKRRDHHTTRVDHQGAEVAARTVNFEHDWKASVWEAGSAGSSETGKGGNGKGLPMNLIKYGLGSYYQQAETTFLTITLEQVVQIQHWRNVKVLGF